jgi:hypothetical protein
MSVFVECKPDETVVVALGVPKRFVTHFQGKDELCKALQQHRDITGVVDEDPLSAQPSYVRQLPSADSVLGIRVQFDRSRNNRLVMVCPRLEDWLITAAKDSDVALSDFGFSAKEPRALHDEINGRLGSLARLLSHLRSAGNTRIAQLESSLRGDEADKTKRL